MDLWTATGSDTDVDQKLAHLHLRAFGQRVREARQKAHLSQEGLAMLAQLDRSYVGGVERGERNISLINIHKIANALKVRPGVLFQ